MQTLHYANYGAVDGLLNECIRRYFFPSRAKEANNNNKKITPDLRLQLREPRDGETLILQAWIHTGLHRFMKIGQSFHK